MSCQKPIRRLLKSLAAVTLAWAAAGCATSATLLFQCDREINGGLVLTIDVIQITDGEEQDIRQVGDDWFYSDLRGRLGARKKTVAVEGGCRETVVFPRLKGYDRLAVIADYQFEGRQTRAQMEFLDWQGTTMQVRVLDRYLTITRSG